MLDPKSTRKAKRATDPVTAYARDVLAGRTLSGNAVRLACRRHLVDTKHGHKRGLCWDTENAERAIRFFRVILRLSEGAHANQPFALESWQEFIVGSLFGWFGPDGFRRFRTAYIEVAKGNGKSPMAAGIAIYMLSADGEAAAECYAAATMRDQANILFQDAVRMVDGSPSLSNRIQKTGKRTVFNLAHLRSGSFFRSVSSEHRGLDGKRVHYAAIDELHEHPSAIVVDKMSASTKGRRQPLIFMITNSGYDRHSVCRQKHEYSMRVLEEAVAGNVFNDSWFAYICQLDEKDDWKNPKCWIKTNPNLDVSITRKYLQEQVRQAEGMPAMENIVKRLNFCVWTEQDVRWMPMEKWDACAGPLGDLNGRECYAGLDLSSTQDLTALVLVFPPINEEKTFSVLPFFWVPEEMIRLKSQRDRVPYDVWARQGFIKTTPGNVIDYDFIRSFIRDQLAPKYQINEVPFDRFKATQIVQQLMGDGLTMVPFGQGFVSMSMPTNELIRLVLRGLLAHGGHPVLRWNASNVVVEQNAPGDIKPTKSRSQDRIDGIVGLIMAIGRAMVHAGDEGGSVYEKRGLVTI